LLLTELAYVYVYCDQSQVRQLASLRRAIYYNGQLLTPLSTRLDACEPECSSLV